MYKLFTSSTQLATEFKRCCEQYDNLEMYIAWIGDPKNLVPFQYLSALPKIHAVVGIAFCQSSPGGIKLLMEESEEVRVAKDNVLFHPKVYIFSTGKQREIFVGSSNFTYQGFYANMEVNVCISGTSDDEEIARFEKDLRKWKTDEFSFIPNMDWLKRYTQRFNKRRNKLDEAGLKDEAEVEEEYNITSWLANAEWDLFLKKVRKGIRRHTTIYQESLGRKMDLLNRAANELTLPWRVSYFQDLEKRKLIGGMNPYGWLGHVAASGDFRRMMKNGTVREQRTIVNSINSLCELKLPLDVKQLELHLNKLVALGPTMKAWGRLLTMMRPDVYCTVSSPRVRKVNAELLDSSEHAFHDVSGYVSLLKVIHASPWYQIKKPKEKKDLEIWERRAAFLDVVLYR